MELSPRVRFYAICFTAVLALGVGVPRWIRYKKIGQQSEVVRKIDSEVRTMEGTMESAAPSETPADLARALMALDRARDETGRLRDERRNYEALFHDIDRSHQLVDSLAQRVRAVSRSGHRDAVQRTELQKAMMDESRHRELLQARLSKAGNGTGLEQAVERVIILEERVRFYELKEKLAAEKAKLERIRQSFF